jgi:outer membrane murein-binding lipoprotein Lpp
MKKTIILFALICVVVSLSGCPRGRNKMPDVVSERVRNYAINSFDNDMTAYNNAVNGGQYETAKIRRDELIFKLKRNIDANYADFENNLFIGKASSNILFDITELGASAAIGITNGERAKTIIGTALTAFKGGRKSIDVNFFREKTTESLISTMRASRSRVEEKINLGLRNEVKDYTLEEALGDLIDYFFAGSLANALVELSQQASEQADKARTQVDIRVKQRLEKEFTQSQSIDDLRNKLSSDLNSTDEATRTGARTRLLRALETLKRDLPALNITFNANDTNTNLFKELQRALKQAATMEDIPTAEILNALKDK